MSERPTLTGEAAAEVLAKLEAATTLPTLPPLVVKIETTSGEVLAIGTANWNYNRDGKQPNAHFGGKINVAGVRCQVGANITVIK